MSAHGLQIDTREFPDPRIDPSGDTISVNASIAYTYKSYNDIRTLSTTSATPGSDRLGFLYVPQLDATDACLNASMSSIPANVTRLDDLPRTFQIIAMAPWVSPSCTLSYLQRAKADRVDALIFFLPNTMDDTPPPANDAAWGLGDGAQWKKNNPYPVYAISAPAAATILAQSSSYSGNTSSAPHGPELTAIYGEESYVRLFVDIDLGSRSSGIPSIWIFLLIIIAVLLFAAGLVSGTMHFIQRRRRTALQRRVAAGQIDLEALGIKRLTVPQHIIDTMPVYAYGASAVSTRSTTTHVLPKQDSLSEPEPPLAPLYQPTCAICLDDFVLHESNVRELPCRHIFHPTCCDAFLRENSSLCPLCKRSTLPKGYCPTNISNVMVRRERNLRRQRRRGNPGGSDVATNTTNAPGNQPPVGHQPNEASVEMSAIHGPPDPPDPTLRASVNGRSEWARRRALSLLGPQAAPDEDNTHAQGGWRPRKLLRSIFPGIG